MLYAKVVFGLRIEGPFDYIVPPEFRGKIKPGCRVIVPLRNREQVGYVVALAGRSSVKNLKPVTALPDNAPLLDARMLVLTRELSNYYCCSWGEAIETAIPEQFRKRRNFSLEAASGLPLPVEERPPGITVLQDLDGKARWDIYSGAIKEAVAGNKAAIIILPDVARALKAQKFLAGRLDCQPAILYRQQPKEAAAWLGINSGKAAIVVGTRSAVFAPLNNLGLIIVDEEQEEAYKQDQVPHYHARRVALVRAAQYGAKVILGSISPSLESLYLLEQQGSRADFHFQGRPGAFPEIRIVDFNNIPYGRGGKKPFLSLYLTNAVMADLAEKKKILFLVNRRGFATFASCSNCNTVMKCQRCNANLVYYYKENVLRCRYCNFKMEAPNICPHCNVSYIRYSGAGTEKIESELSRQFPQARIMILEDPAKFDAGAADIFVATEGAFALEGCRFDTTVALSIDRHLNRPDLRASEKTFALLLNLLRLTGQKMIIQTAIPRHRCFTALAQDKIATFYEEEFRERRQLDFPPYGHLAIIKIRGRNEQQVRDSAAALDDNLKKTVSRHGMKVLSLNPSYPSKLRGNFYWQILLRCRDVLKAARFLKLRLKDSPHSGIIVTVDIDPL